MLQPVELHAVSRRFAREIAGLRTFLSLAAIPIDTDRAMHVLAERVASDAAFHRDLTSHLWVLLDEGESSIRQADLLGMLALAACGAEHAARTQEHDALTLLRFVMEAKHTLERGAPVVNRSALPQPALSKANSVPPLTTFAATKPPKPDTQPQPATQPKSSLPETSAAVVASSAVRPEAVEPVTHGVRRRRLLYISVGACALVLLLIAFGLLRRGAERGSVSRMTVDESVPSRGSAATQRAPLKNDSGVFESNSADSRAKEAVRGRPNTPESFAPSTANAPSPSLSSPARSNFDPTRREAPASLAAPFVASAPSLGGTGSTPVSASGLPSVVAAPAVSVGRPRSGASVPVAVPPEILSKRLDSPTLPAYATGSEDTGRKYPRLLRRRTSTSTSDRSATDSILTAELRAPDLSNTTSSQRGAGASSPVRGSVRSACLGIMASNLIYGPTPVYPAAAAAAHVQGQVTIQANIDRDGAVNSARVVSGPPLLRDAAMDAVQRWRYRPFLAGGKPSPTGATAVVDFELQ